MKLARISPQLYATTPFLFCSRAVAHTQTALGE
jgi:hypothetical protein